MRPILPALLLLCAPPAAALEIHADNGGTVLLYVMRFEAADKPIRIMGPCRSACTLALAYPGTCVGPDASLTFHAASTPVLTRWMERAYPPPVRAWIRSRGGLTRKLITLKGAELRRIVKECRP